MSPPPAAEWGFPPMRTTLDAEKITRRAREIAGRTLRTVGHRDAICRDLRSTLERRRIPRKEAFRFDSAGRVDNRTAGWCGREDGRALGTYIHGLFDDDSFRHAFLNAARAACRWAPANGYSFAARERDERLNRLADHVRQALDLRLIWQWLGATSHGRPGSTTADHRRLPQNPFSSSLSLSTASATGLL